MLKCFTTVTCILPARNFSSTRVLATVKKLIRKKKKEDRHSKLMILKTRSNFKATSIRLLGKVKYTVVSGQALLCKSFPSMLAPMKAKIEAAYCIRHRTVVG